jgi:AcrR family transcriptional regulator
MNRRRRAGGTKRFLVLDAVIDVLAERGYESTRFTDVTAASGVAISTLQSYFGSREDMVVEAMERATDLEVDALESAAEAEPDSWQRLVAMIDRSLDSAPATQRMLVEFWRSAMRDDELRAQNETVLTRYRAPFVAAVVQGRERGVFTLVHAPDDIIDFVLTTLAGAIVFRSLNASPAGLRAILLVQLRAMLGVED